MTSGTRYLHLLFYKAYADLRAESERTYIGVLWWILDPIVNMLVYYVVFAIFLRRGGEDFAPFLLVGLVPWKWFTIITRTGAMSIINGAPLMREAYIPKVVFPLSQAAMVTFKFLVSFLVLIGFLVLYGYPIGPEYLALPVLIACQLLFSVAITCLLAAVLPFLPDLQALVENGLALLFFLSGIFYSGRTLSPESQYYFYMNPVAHFIEGFRDVMLDGGWPDPRPLLVIALGSGLLLVAALAILKKNDAIYPRIVT